MHSSGEFVGKFEQMCADYTGSKYAVACVNGTAALHIALQLSGVQRGDEVITQALTFIAISLRYYLVVSLCYRSL